jgi:SAM-dependent methyltransferase
VTRSKPAHFSHSREWWQDYFDDDVRDVLFAPERIQQAEEQTPALIEWLSLKPGDRLLDLACGIGRFALPLARRGIRVHGVDISSSYVRTALRCARKEQLPASFSCEDMRRIRFVNEFDAVINMFTSFGYFEREEDHLLTLKRVTAALKPGGRFLIDVANRDIIIKNFRAQEWSRSGKLLILEERELDYERSRTKNRWVIYALTGYLRRQRKVVEKIFSLRLFSPHELILLIQQAGMKVIRTASSLDGAPLSPDRHRILILARKPE